MRSVYLTTAVACVGLIGAEQAVACSCAPIRAHAAIREADAAINAQLIEVRSTDESNPNADLKFVYRVLRVFKGAPGRERGDTLAIRVDGGSSCAPPDNKGRRYGLLLDRRKKRLTASLCSVVSPKKLRRAAEGEAKGKICGRA
jgi:hypothetical protein